MISLRPYQTEIIDRTREHLRRVRRVLIQLPTGGGKTALASRMLHGAADRGKRVWFLVHRRELVKQVSAAFTLDGLDHSIVATDQPFNYRAMAQICSIQTLIKRAHLLPAPDLICWDECHHVASKSWANLAAQYPRAFHVGLSATPERMDGRGLADHFDAMVCGPTVADLIDQGYLSKYRLFAPATVDVSGLHTRMGDYVTSEAAELVNKPKITGDAISHYRRHCDGARAIVFAVSIEHSKAIAAAFNAEGIPALHIDGNTDGGLRDAMMQDFRDGRVRVLSNVDLFGEGFDCPAIEATILLRPTQSLAMYLQQVGRALRPSPGKQQAIILDHVSNSSLHGLPDEPRTWELTATVRRERPKLTIPSPRICSACFGASRSGSRVCVVCGETFAVESREIKQVDGELADVTDIKRVRRPANPAKDLAGLIELGRKRGYASPERWANHVWAGRLAKRAG